MRYDCQIERLRREDEPFFPSSSDSFILSHAIPLQPIVTFAFACTIFPLKKKIPFVLMMMMMMMLLGRIYLIDCTHESSFFISSLFVHDGCAVVVI